MSAETSSRGVRDQNGPLRVAHVVGKMVGGGVEAVAMNYYRYVDRDRIQFDFLVDGDSTVVPQAEIESLGGRVIMVPPYQQIAKYIPSLVSIFRDNGYQVVHSHLNALSVCPLLAATIAGVPVRIAHSQSTAGGGELMRNALKYSLRSLSRVFATHYLACSERTGEWLFGAGAMGRGEVHIVPNAIELRRFSYREDVRERLRQELGLAGHFVLGHVGRFTNQKNHSFLIDILVSVLKREPSAVLLLVGDGALRPLIEQKVEHLGLGDRVRFLGMRSAVELYQAMDVFVLPSFYEGYPVVGVESQATGLPGVYAHEVGHDSRLLPATRFMSLKQSAEEWAATVLSVACTEDRGGQSALVQSSGFDVSDCAPRLVALYMKFVGESA
jgi:glycosyltransferase involved in cell wall biosynthesis